MPLTRTSNLRFIRFGVGVGVATLIIAYAIWRSLDYVRGPTIIVFSPINGSGIASSTVTVSGQALRVNSLGIDGNSISVDQQGNFSQTIVVFPGLNVITLTASDQFGRNTRKELDLLGLNGFPTSKSNITLSPALISTSTSSNTNSAGISSTTGQ